MEYFVANAARFPNKPAIISQQGVIRYAMLHDCSECLKGFLLAHGATSEAIIPLIFKLITTMRVVLKYFTLCIHQQFIREDNLQ